MQKRDNERREIFSSVNIYGSGYILLIVIAMLFT